MLIALLIITVVYYMGLLMASFGTIKTKDSMIHTKTDFIKGLIPFNMWVRFFIQEFKKLD